MQDIGENQTNNPYDSFVEEVNNENANNSTDEYAAQLLRINEETANELSNKDKSADISLKKLYGWGILVILIIWEFLSFYFHGNN